MSVEEIENEGFPYRLPVFHLVNDNSTNLFLNEISIDDARANISYNDNALRFLRKKSSVNNINTQSTVIEDPKLFSAQISTITTTADTSNDNDSDTVDTTKSVSQVKVLGDYYTTAKINTIQETTETTQPIKLNQNSPAYETSLISGLTLPNMNTNTEQKIQMMGNNVLGRFLAENVVIEDPLQSLPINLNGKSSVLSSVYKEVPSEKNTIQFVGRSAQNIQYNQIDEYNNFYLLLPGTKLSPGTIIAAGSYEEEYYEYIFNSSNSINQIAYLMPNTTIIKNSIEYSTTTTTYETDETITYFKSFSTGSFVSLIPMDFYKINDDKKLIFKYEYRNNDDTVATITIEYTPSETTTSIITFKSETLETIISVYKYKDNILKVYDDKGEIIGEYAANTEITIEQPDEVKPIKHERKYFEKPDSYFVETTINNYIRVNQEYNGIISGIPDATIITETYIGTDNTIEIMHFDLSELSEFNYVAIKSGESVIATYKNKKYIINNTTITIDSREITNTYKYGDSAIKIEYDYDNPNTKNKITIPTLYSLTSINGSAITSIYVPMSNTTLYKFRKYPIITINDSKFTIDTTTYTIINNSIVSDGQHEYPINNNKFTINNINYTISNNTITQENAIGLQCMYDGNKYFIDFGDYTFTGDFNTTTSNIGSQSGGNYTNAKWSEKIRSTIYYDENDEPTIINDNYIIDRDGIFNKSNYNCTVNYDKSQSKLTILISTTSETTIITRNIKLYDEMIDLTIKNANINTTLTTIRPIISNSFSTSYSFNSIVSTSTTLTPLTYDYKYEQFMDNYKQNGTYKITDITLKSHIVIGNKNINELTTDTTINDENSTINFVETPNNLIETYNYNYINNNQNFKITVPESFKDERLIKFSSETTIKTTTITTQFNGVNGGIGHVEINNAYGGKVYTPITITTIRTANKNDSSEIDKGFLNSFEAPKIKYFGAGSKLYYDSELIEIPEDKAYELIDVSGFTINNVKYDITNNKVISSINTFNIINNTFTIDTITYTINVDKAKITATNTISINDNKFTIDTITYTINDSQITNTNTAIINDNTVIISGVKYVFGKIVSDGQNKYTINNNQFTIDTTTYTINNSIVSDGENEYPIVDNKFTIDTTTYTIDDVISDGQHEYIITDNKFVIGETEYTINGTQITNIIITPIKDNKFTIGNTEYTINNTQITNEISYLINSDKCFNVHNQYFTATATSTITETVLFAEYNTNYVLGGSEKHYVLAPTESFAPLYYELKNAYVDALMTTTHSAGQCINIGQLSEQLLLKHDEPVKKIKIDSIPTTATSNVMVITNQIEEFTDGTVICTITTSTTENLSIYSIQVSDSTTIYYDLQYDDAHVYDLIKYLPEFGLIKCNVSVCCPDNTIILTNANPNTTAQPINKFVLQPGYITKGYSQQLTNLKSNRIQLYDVISPYSVLEDKDEYVDILPIALNTSFNSAVVMNGEIITPYIYVDTNCSLQNNATLIKSEIISSTTTITMSTGINIITTITTCYTSLTITFSFREYYITDESLILNDVECTYDTTNKILEYNGEIYIADDDGKIEADGVEYTFNDEYVDYKRIITVSTLIPVESSIEHDELSSLFNMKQHSDEQTEKLIIDSLIYYHYDKSILVCALEDYETDLQEPKSDIINIDYDASNTESNVNAYNNISLKLNNIKLNNKYLISNDEIIRLSPDTLGDIYNVYYLTTSTTELSFTTIAPITAMLNNAFVVDGVLQYYVKSFNENNTLTNGTMEIVDGNLSCKFKIDKRIMYTAYTTKYLTSFDDILANDGCEYRRYWSDNKRIEIVNQHGNTANNTVIIVDYHGNDVNVNFYNNATFLDDSDAKILTLTTTKKITFNYNNSKISVVSNCISNNVEITDNITSSTTSAMTISLTYKTLTNFTLCNSINMISADKYNLIPVETAETIYDFEFKSVCPLTFNLIVGTNTVNAAESDDVDYVQIKEDKQNEMITVITTNYLNKNNEAYELALPTEWKFEHIDHTIKNYIDFFNMGLRYVDVIEHSEYCNSIQTIAINNETSQVVNVYNYTLIGDKYYNDIAFPEIEHNITQTLYMNYKLKLVVEINDDRVLIGDYKYGNSDILTNATSNILCFANEYKVYNSNIFITKDTFDEKNLTPLGEPIEINECVYTEGTSGTEFEKSSKSIIHANHYGNCMYTILKDVKSISLYKQSANSAESTIFIKITDSSIALDSSSTTEITTHTLTVYLNNLYKETYTLGETPYYISVNESKYGLSTNISLPYGSILDSELVNGTFKTTTKSTIISPGDLFIVGNSEPILTNYYVNVNDDKINMSNTIKPYFITENSGSIILNSFDLSTNATISEYDTINSLWSVSVKNIDLITSMTSLTIQNLATKAKLTSSTTLSIPFTATLNNIKFDVCKYGDNKFGIPNGDFNFECKLYGVENPISTNYQFILGCTPEQVLTNDAITFADKTYSGTFYNIAGNINSTTGSTNHDKDDQYHGSTFLYNFQDYGQSNTTIQITLDSINLNVTFHTEYKIAISNIVVQKLSNDTIAIPEFNVMLWIYNMWVEYEYLIDKPIQIERIIPCYDYYVYHMFYAEPKISVNTMPDVVLKLGDYNGTVMIENNKSDSIIFKNENPNLNYRNDYEYQTKFDSVIYGLQKLNMDYDVNTYYNKHEYTILKGSYIDPTETNDGDDNQVKALSIINGMTITTLKAAGLVGYDNTTIEDIKITALTCLANNSKKSINIYFSASNPIPPTNETEQCIYIQTSTGSTNQTETFELNSNDCIYLNTYGKLIEFTTNTTTDLYIPENLSGDFDLKAGSIINTNTIDVIGLITTDTFKPKVNYEVSIDTNYEINVKSLIYELNGTEITNITFETTIIPFTTISETDKFMTKYEIKEVNDTEIIIDFISRCEQATGTIIKTINTITFSTESSTFTKTILAGSTVFTENEYSPFKVSPTTTIASGSILNAGSYIASGSIINNVMFCNDYGVSWTTSGTFNKCILNPTVMLTGQIKMIGFIKSDGTDIKVDITERTIELTSSEIYTVRDIITCSIIELTNATITNYYKSKINNIIVNETLQQQIYVSIDSTIAENSVFAYGSIINGSVINNVLTTNADININYLLKNSLIDVSNVTFETSFIGKNSIIKSGSTIKTVSKILSLENAKNCSYIKGLTQELATNQPCYLAYNYYNEYDKEYSSKLCTNSDDIEYTDITNNLNINNSYVAGAHNISKGSLLNGEFLIKDLIVNNSMAILEDDYVFVKAVDNGTNKIYINGSVNIYGNDEYGILCINKNAQDATTHNINMINYKFNTEATIGFDNLISTLKAGSVIAPGEYTCLSSNGSLSDNVYLSGNDTRTFKLGDTIAGGSFGNNLSGFDINQLTRITDTPFVYINNSLTTLDNAQITDFTLINENGEILITSDGLLTTEILNSVYSLDTFNGLAIVKNDELNNVPIIWNYHASETDNMYAFNTDYTVGKIGQLTISTTEIIVSNETTLTESTTIITFTDDSIPDVILNIPAKYIPSSEKTITVKIIEINNNTMTVEMDTYITVSCRNNTKNQNVKIISTNATTNNVVGGIAEPGQFVEYKNVDSATKFDKLTYKFNVYGYKCTAQTTQTTEIILFTQSLINGEKFEVNHFNDIDTTEITTDIYNLTVLNELSTPIIIKSGYLIPAGSIVASASTINREYYISGTSITTDTYIYDYSVIATNSKINASVNSPAFLPTSESEAPTLISQTTTTTFEITFTTPASFASVVYTDTQQTDKVLSKFACVANGTTFIINTNEFNNITKYTKLDYDVKLMPRILLKYTYYNKATNTTDMTKIIQNNQKPGYYVNLDFKLGLSISDLKIIGKKINDTHYELILYPNLDVYQVGQCRIEHIWNCNYIDIKNNYIKPIKLFIDLTSINGLVESETLYNTTTNKLDSISKFFESDPNVSISDTYNNFTSCAGFHLTTSPLFNTVKNSSLKTTATTADSTDLFKNMLYPNESDGENNLFLEVDKDYQLKLQYYIFMINETTKLITGITTTDSTESIKYTISTTDSTEIIQTLLNNLSITKYNDGIYDYQISGVSLSSSTITFSCIISNCIIPKHPNTQPVSLDKAIVDNPTQLQLTFINKNGDELVKILMDICDYKCCKKEFGAVGGTKYIDYDIGFMALKKYLNYYANGNLCLSDEISDRIFEMEMVVEGSEIIKNWIPASPTRLIEILNDNDNMNGLFKIQWYQHYYDSYNPTFKNYAHSCYDLTISEEFKYLIFSLSYLNIRQFVSHPNSYPMNAKQAFKGIDSTNYKNDVKTSLMYKKCINCGNLACCDNPEIDVMDEDEMDQSVESYPFGLGEDKVKNGDMVIFRGNLPITPIYITTMMPFIDFDESECVMSYGEINFVTDGGEILQSNNYKVKYQNSTETEKGYYYIDLSCQAGDIKQTYTQKLQNVVVDNEDAEQIKNIIKSGSRIKPGSVINGNNIVSELYIKQDTYLNTTTLLKQGSVLAKGSVFNNKKYTATTTLNADQVLTIDYIYNNIKEFNNDPDYIEYEYEYTTTTTITTQPEITTLIIKIGSTESVELVNNHTSSTALNTLTITITNITTNTMSITTIDNDYKFETQITISDPANETKPLTINTTLSTSLATINVVNIAKLIKINSVSGNGNTYTVNDDNEFMIEGVEYTIDLANAIVSDSTTTYPINNNKFAINGVEYTIKYNESNSTTNTVDFVKNCEVKVENVNVYKRTLRDKIQNEKIPYYYVPARIYKTFHIPILSDYNKFNDYSKFNVVINKMNIVYKSVVFTEKGLLKHDLTTPIYITNELIDDNGNVLQNLAAYSAIQGSQFGAGSYINGTKLTNTTTFQNTIAYGSIIQTGSTINGAYIDNKITVGYLIKSGSTIALGSEIHTSTETITFDKITTTETDYLLVPDDSGYCGIIKSGSSLAPGSVLLYLLDSSNYRKISEDLIMNSDNVSIESDSVIVVGSILKPGSQIELTKITTDTTLQTTTELKTMYDIDVSSIFEPTTILKSGSTWKNKPLVYDMKIEESLVLSESVEDENYYLDTIYITPGKYNTVNEIIESINESFKSVFYSNISKTTTEIIFNQDVKINYDSPAMLIMYDIYGNTYNINIPWEDWDFYTMTATLKNGSNIKIYVKNAETGEISKYITSIDFGDDEEAVFNFRDSNSSFNLKRYFESIEFIYSLKIQGVNNIKLDNLYTDDIINDSLISEILLNDKPLITISTMATNKKRIVLTFADKIIPVEFTTSEMPNDPDYMSLIKQYQNYQKEIDPNAGKLTILNINTQTSTTLTPEEKEYIQTFIKAEKFYLQFKQNKEGLWKKLGITPIIINEKLRPKISFQKNIDEILNNRLLNSSAYVIKYIYLSSFFTETIYLSDWMKLKHRFIKRISNDNYEQYEGVLNNGISLLDLWNTTWEAEKMPYMKIPTKFNIKISDNEDVEFNLNIGENNNTIADIDTLERDEDNNRLILKILKNINVEQINELWVYIDNENHYGFQNGVNAELKVEWN